MSGTIMSGNVQNYGVAASSLENFWWIMYTTLKEVLCQLLSYRQI